MHKKHRALIGIIVALVSIFFMLTGCSRSAFRESKDEVFSDDYELLAFVAEYLAGLEYEDIYIPDTLTNGEISVSGKSYFIADDDIVNAMTLLRESGYSVISKHGGIVTFVYWSNKDVGTGFAYSSDGSEPRLQFQTYLEKLSTANWFYYEEDFNLWKQRNQGKS